MAETSTIEWTDATWNIITGCSVLSPGCKLCYAMRLAGTRLAHIPSRAGLTRDTKAGPVWTGEVRFNAEWLDQPLRWRRPRMIFVCAHGDLFHEAVPDEWIDQVFAIMAAAHWHTFQVLTKRADRMRAYLRDHAAAAAERWVAQSWAMVRADSKHPLNKIGWSWAGEGMPWPLSNVWLGVSAEDQARADERIPHLLQTPAAVRWLSAEPLLGPVDLTRLRPEGHSGWTDAIGRREHRGPATYQIETGLDWVVAGGESGTGARECWVPNVRSLLRQCKAAGIPFFGKQLGAFVTDRNDADWEGCTPEGWPDVDPYDIEHDINGYREEYQGAPVRVRLHDKKGGDMAEWPADLRVREMPDAGE